PGQTVQLRHTSITDAQLADLVKELDGKTSLDQELQFNQLFKQLYISHNGDRYVVKFPWIEPINLATNEKIALARLHSLIRKLVDTGRLDIYRTQLFEMMKLDFAEKISKTDLKSRVYLMPHQDVER